MDYCIWIVSPAGYPHSRCFEEVALSLQASFRELGHDVPIVGDDSVLNYSGKPIIIGAHLFPKMWTPSFGEWVIYNLEQITSETSNDYLSLLKKSGVWDYSQSNIGILLQSGIKAKWCGIGYMPELTRIQPQEEDIDVLFIGSMNERRRKVIQALLRQKVKVVSPFNCYGEERDKLIARSKIILNMHFYDSKVFEIVRCSYMFANKKCVVSEYGDDKELEGPFYPAAYFTDYDNLTAACLYLLEHDDERERQAKHGFEVFSKMSQVEMLKGVL